MARNRVEVDLDGRDNLSGSVDGIVGKIRSGVLQASLIGNALDAGFSVAQNAASSLMGAIQGAAAAQTDVIKSVGSLAETISVPYAQAEKLNQDITSGLAKYAAALPGSTDTYVQLFRSVSDDVAMTNREMNNGVFNTQQYTQQVTDLTAKFAALGDGLQFGQLTNAMGGLLGGQSIPALKQLEYFQRNPALVKRLESLLNGKNLKDLTSGERLELTLKALDATLTDDTVDRLGGTLDGAIQGVRTTLFDPNVGILGLLRDLDANAEGQQSAFDAINQAAQSLIGSNGLFYVVGDFLSAIGLEFQDPMVVLRSATLLFKEKVDFISKTLKTAASLFEGSPQEATQYLGQQITAFIAGFNLSGLSDRLTGVINSIFQRASTFNYAPAFQMIGKLIADVFDQALVFLRGLDYGAIAATAINLIGSLIRGVGSFLLNLDLSSYISVAAIVGGVGLVGLIGTAITTGAGLIAAAVGFAFSVLAPRYVTSFLAATAGIPLILAVAAALSIAALAKSIIDNWAAIVAGVSQFFAPILEAFMAGVNVVAGIIMGDRELIMGSVRQLGQAIRDTIEQVTDQIAFLTGGQTAGQQRAEDTAMLAEQRFQAARAANPGSVAIPAPTSPTVPSRTAGYIPNAASGLNVGGLLSAAIREGQQMPSGAGLAIANTSEAILNQAQQRALANRLAAPSGGGISIGSLTIQTAATDAQGIANDIMQAIANAYRQHQQSKLTAIAT